MSNQSSAILITGGTSGLGLATTRLLSKSGAHDKIIITGRTLPPGLLDELTNVTFIRLDLSTHDDVRGFAKDYLSRGFPPLSALILNAGYQGTEEVEMTSDGIEKHVAVNHVNHSLLLYLLADQLLPNAHIVVIASSMHDPAFRRANFKYVSAEAAARTPDTVASFGGRGNRYALSKFCNVLFTYALDRYIKEHKKGWVVLALDPGIMATGLFRHNGAVISTVFGFLFSLRITRYLPGLHDVFAPEYTAATLVRLATEPGFESGKHYGTEGAAEMKTSPQSYDQALQKDLWDWTVKEVLTEDEASRWSLSA